MTKWIYKICQILLPQQINVIHNYGTLAIVSLCLFLSNLEFLICPFVNLGLIVDITKHIYDDKEVNIAICPPEKIIPTERSEIGMIFEG